MELKHISKYFPDFTHEQFRQLADYTNMLLNWNRKVNLISRKNEGAVEINHILHSLAILKVQEFPDGSRIFDLGTGGGLPGIPLAIALPNCTFHLNDSIGKKARALSLMAKELQLNNVSVKQERAEEHEGQYNFVVTRAVAPAQKIINWSAHLMEKGKGQIIALKGGDLTKELAKLNQVYKVFNISTLFKDPFFDMKKIIVIEM